MTIRRTHAVRIFAAVVSAVAVLSWGRVFAAGPMMTTAAGTGSPGYAGDGGPAEKAQLRDPFDVVLDRGGNIFFSDTFNHCIRRIDARSGVITTVAGCGRKGYTGDGGPA